jgi:hypothetical protein
VGGYYGGGYYGGDVYAPAAYYEPTPVYTYPQPVIVNQSPTYDYPAVPATMVAAPGTAEESP